MSVKLHVVTYVKDSELGTEDVLAYDTLAVAEDKAAGLDGDATKGVVQTAKDHQCDGSDSCGGCMAIHAYAEERIVARRQPDDKVAVVWRRFHPLIARGEASAGKPFKADDEQFSIRVEVREIVDDPGEKLTKGKVSVLSLRALEAELAQKKTVGDTRRELRDAYRLQAPAFDIVMQGMEEYEERFANLPGQPMIQKVLGTVRAELEKISEETREQVSELMKGDVVPADGAARLQQLITAGVARMRQSLTQCQAIENQLQDTINLQEQIRALVAGIDQTTAGLDETVESFPGFVRGPHDKLLAKVLDDTNKLLGRTENIDDAQQLAELRNELPALTLTRNEIVGAIDEAVNAERVLAAAFNARIGAVNAWANGTGEQQLIEYLEAGAGVAGFALPYWAGEAKKVAAKVGGAAGNLGELSYANKDDQKALTKAEKALGPVMDFRATVDADIAKRCGELGVHATMELGGQERQMPMASVEAIAVHPDGSVDVRVRILNTDTRPIAIGFKSGDEIISTEVLASSGQHASFNYEGLQNPMSFVLLGVSNEPLNEDGEGNFASVVVPSETIRVSNPGARLHVLPSWFEKEQESGGQQLFTQDRDVTEYTQIDVPGLG